MPDVRASDREREEALRQLRVAEDEGRLSVEELDERIGWLLHLKTRGEIKFLLSDLPSASLLPPPPPAPKADERWERELSRDRVAIGRFLAATMAVFAIGSVVGLAARQVVRDASSPALPAKQPVPILHHPHVGCAKIVSWNGSLVAEYNRPRSAYIMPDRIIFVETRSGELHEVTLGHGSDSITTDLPCGKA